MAITVERTVYSPNVHTAVLLVMMKWKVSMTVYNGQQWMDNDDNNDRTTKTMGQ